MKIITVTGYKGGCSKSTTAIHVATFLSAYGDVLLTDGDPNRTALNWSKRGKLPFTVADERQAMKLVSGRDFVVIDTPARPHTDDLKELAKGADLLILPTIPDVVSLEPMLETANDLGKANYRVLIAMNPPKPSREGEQMRDELIGEGLPVFQTMIRRSTAGVTRAALQGIPLRDLPGKYRLAWADYQALGKEILEIIGE